MHDPPSSTSFRELPPDASMWAQLESNIRPRAPNLAPPQPETPVRPFPKLREGDPTRLVGDPAFRTAGPLDLLYIDPPGLARASYRLGASWGACCAQCCSSNVLGLISFRRSGWYNCGRARPKLGRAPADLCRFRANIGQISAAWAPSQNHWPFLSAALRRAPSRATLGGSKGGRVRLIGRFFRTTADPTRGTTDNGASEKEQGATSGRRAREGRKWRLVRGGCVPIQSGRPPAPSAVAPPS